MTNEQRVMIVTGVKSNIAPDKIAETIGVPEQDVKIFIASWFDRGKPDLTT